MHREPIAVNDGVVVVARKLTRDSLVAVAVRGVCDCKFAPHGGRQN